MVIFITGGTGLIGQALVRKWLAQHHQITILTRSPTKALALFQHHPHLTAVDSLPVSLQANVVVNLAGEPIFNRRWSNKQKKRLWDSRIKLTEKLTALINAANTPPDCFISASASGYYGNTGEQAINEQQPADHSFVASLCQQWEKAAKSANTRVCLLRTGFVLSPQGGALQKMLPLYQCGFGGKLGNGKQFMPWIALEDMVNAIDFLIHHPSCHGAFNLSAPNPVTNTEFNRLLARQLKRPYFAQAPACLLKLLLGERAALLLDSQNMQPQKLLQQGFHFKYSQLQDYFSATFGKPNINV
ncbi:TIGR01777 family oxidoreductase [Pasteurellaceae bacterium 22721_9_1]